MKILIKGNLKESGNRVEIKWLDGKASADKPEAMNALIFADMENYGEHLGHILSGCKETHSHIENDQCFRVLIDGILKEGYFVETMEMTDGGEILTHNGWADYPPEELN